VLGALNRFLRQRGDFALEPALASSRLRDVRTVTHDDCGEHPSEHQRQPTESHIDPAHCSERADDRDEVLHERGRGFAEQATDVLGIAGQSHGELTRSLGLAPKPIHALYAPQQLRAQGQSELLTYAGVRYLFRC